MPAPLPDRAHLALVIQTPHIADTVGDGIAKDQPRLRAHVLVSGREDDLVRVQHGAVRELQARRQDLADFLALLHLNLTVDDQLASANIDVVPAAALQVLDQQACIHGPSIDAEPGLLKALDGLRVVLVNNLGHLGLLQLEELRRDTPEIQVGVFGRGPAFFVEALQRDVCDRVDGHDAGRAALHHGHLVALLEVVLRDVVARVAGSDHHSFLALRRRVRAWELGAVADAVAFEVLLSLECRRVLLA